MWCWGRMWKISCTDRMRNEDVLHRVKKERNILHTVNRRKANWIGHILHRNCLLHRVNEGKIEGWIGVTGRWERRRKQLLDNVKEKKVWYKLKEEAIDRTVWWTRLGRSYGHIRQISGWRKYIIVGRMNWMSCSVLPQRQDGSPQKLRRLITKLTLYYSSS